MNTYLRDSQIATNFFIRAGIRNIFASKTVTEADIGNGLNQIRYMIRPYYRLLPGLTMFSEYEHEQDYGAFKAIQIRNSEPVIQDTVTLGLAMLY